ncbi:MAG: hypothetical protein KDB07_04400, partial [Planctomycetes bacterium]|nr:hypothetical protein [Planctomycetota bacterium]
MFESTSIDRTFELRLRVAMSLTAKFWPSHFTPLLERFGSLTQALEADSRELNEIQGLRGKVKLWREAIESSELDDE